MGNQRSAGAKLDPSCEIAGAEPGTTEAALRAQNAYFKDALDKLSQGVCMFDSEQRLIFANRRYAEFYQLPDDLMRPGTTFRQILEDRIDRGIYAGGSPVEYLEDVCKTVAANRPSTRVLSLVDGRVVSVSHQPMSGGWMATHDDITELRKAEAALRASEELFSRAFQASPAACAISAPEDGYHYDVNEGWMKLLGYTREEALANSALTLGIWADPAERARFVGLLKKHGSFKAFEAVFCRKNGQRIWVLVSGAYVEFHGEPRLFVIYDDITQRKKAEAALRESEELFSKAFHTSPAACAIAAPEDGRHYDVNEGWMKLLGYSREEALANSSLTLGIWADPAERARFVGLLKKHGSTKAFETKFCRKNGEEIDVLVSGVYVEFRGEPRLFVVYDDITQRKESERLLIHQASTISLMKSIAFAANESTDLDTALTYCLDRICRFTGWDVGHVLLPAKDDQSALTSSNCWFLADEDRFLAFKDGTRKHPCGSVDDDLWCQTVSPGETTWVRDLGSRVGSSRAETAQKAGLTSGVAFPIKVCDSVVAILEFYAIEPMEQTAGLADILTEVGTQMARVFERAIAQAELVAHRDHLEDLVERRTAQVEHQAQELKAALAKEKEVNALQSQFVAMASHEFRTPLTIIDSTAQRLERRADRLEPPDIVQRSQKIRSAVKRMITLIESMLSSASFDAGKFKMEVQSYNLRAIVDQVCARQQEISPLHSIVSRLEELPEDMYGDPKLLEQAFANLLSNAVKYAPDKPDILVVGRVEGNRAFVAVKDEGLGIPEKEVDRLFDRFFRASTSTGIAGTGIGLSLVSQIIELHGGQIDVESTEGEGSLFTVSLPLNSLSKGTVDRAKDGASPTS